MKKPLGPRISEQAYQFLFDTFSSPNAGAGYVLEAFYPLYRHALEEIRGRLTRGELMLLIDVFNGTALTAPIAGQHLVIQATDGITLDGLGQKWEVDADNFLQHLRELTSFQTGVLEIWANSYWYGGPTTRELSDIEEYVKKLL